MKIIYDDQRFYPDGELIRDDELAERYYKIKAARNPSTLIVIATVDEFNLPEEDVSFCDDLIRLKLESGYSV